MAGMHYGGPVPSISEIIHKAIDERVFPGAAVAYGTCGKLCFSHVLLALLVAGSGTIYSLFGRIWGGKRFPVDLTAEPPFS